MLPGKWLRCILLLTFMFSSETDSGWPRLSRANPLDRDIKLLQEDLQQHGTSNQPDNAAAVYVNELSDEDRQLTQVFGRMMYSSDFRSVVHDANSSGLDGVFCVANINADLNALKAGLDWACGSGGGANCSAIQPGQPCYVANNLPALASYAYNDYYHKTQANGGTCDFNNTATISNTDPSFGSCVFAGSSGTGTNTGGGGGTNSSSGFVPTSPPPASYDNNASSQQFLQPNYLTALMILFAWFF